VAAGDPVSATIPLGSQLLELAHGDRAQLRAGHSAQREALADV
jgi:hypothetical protein